MPSSNLIQLIDVPSSIAQVTGYLRDLQQRICLMLEQEDGQAIFQEDAWQHPSGGGGYTRTLAEGQHLEKAGVNFSHVQGTQLPQSATQKRPDLQQSQHQFQACGVSVVVHPLNPYAPTVHLNVRFIVVQHDNQLLQWWFGGGFDLTPYYGFVEDCEHWHNTAKQACAEFDAVYPYFKKWCDDYFYLKHRNEPRGIGGLFFDDVNNLQNHTQGPAWDFAKCFKLMRSVGDHFILAYQPILARRKNHIYGKREKDFQAYRRGRYVEFNLLYDRGTLFGLQSGGRTESILMSLPPSVRWEYDYQPEPGSKEAELYERFLKVSYGKVSVNGQI